MLLPSLSPTIYLLMSLVSCLSLPLSPPMASHCQTRHMLWALVVWAQLSRSHLPLPYLCPLGSSYRPAFPGYPLHRSVPTWGLVLPLFSLSQHFPWALVWLAPSNPLGLSYTSPLREAIGATPVKEIWPSPPLSPLSSRSGSVHSLAST